MTIVVVLAALVVAMAITMAMVARRWVWRTRKARPVLIELQDGRTVEGLQTRIARDWITLTAARTFDADGHPIAVDGNMHIPRTHVAWLIDGHKP